MIASLAASLAASARKRHLLFLAAAAATILLVGYHYGAYDESVHLTFLRAEADPTLYPGDAFVQLRTVYFSYFWLAFLPFLRLGWLEPALFVTHIATTYLTFWAIWNLSSTLFHSPLVSLFAVLASIVPHFGFGGFSLTENAPLSRTFVLPFLIIAVDQFLKNRIVLAFLLAGLLYNIHVISVNFVLAMFGLACLLEWRRIGWKTILLGAAVFIAAASPVLFWKTGTSPVDFTLRPAWLAFLERTLFYHLYLLVGRFPESWVFFLGGLGAIAMFFIARPKAAAAQPILTSRTFFYSYLIVLVVLLITVLWLPVTIIIESQISRVGLWIVILAYLFFANYLAGLYESKRLPSLSFWLLLLMFFVAPSPALVVVAWLLVTLPEGLRWMRPAVILVPAMLIANFLVFWSHGFWQPGIFVYGQRTPWVAVQEWARDNTAKNARFITPPQGWNILRPDWRVYSERPTVVTLSEILVAAFQPGYEQAWSERFDAVAPGALNRFNGDFFSNMQTTSQAYAALTDAAVLQVACRYNAGFMVDDESSARSLSVIYRNPQYVVYDLRSFACK